ncbi:ankyrin repeat [Fusarium sp. NRRL 52700]|nr:ankyrin repeat [Fusarium sp. NRRL 52700]
MMSLPKESAADGALARVREWNVKVVEPDPSSAASRLVKQCAVVFKKALKSMSNNPNIPTNLFRRFERCYSSLLLWDEGYGIGRGELDVSMARSRTLRRSILEPLVSIARTLIDRLIPRLDLGDARTDACSLLEVVVTEAKTGLHDAYNDFSDRDESGSETSFSESNDLNDVAEDLWTDTRCLIDLAPLIESPAPDSMDPSYDDIRETARLKPHLPYIDKIMARFPTAEEALIDRLASANLVRYRENKEAREANHALQESELETGLDFPYTESVSKFHDSGVGTSINTASVYAETIMSYRREGQKSLSIPPLPADAKRGKPFDCIACGKKVHITNDSAWKRHLYLDLRPWICHEPVCNYSNKLFTDRESWIQHLALDHGMEPEWRGFDCPLCDRTTGSGCTAISQHLSAHLEEISLAALPLDVDSDAEDDVDDKFASEGSERAAEEHDFKFVEAEMEKVRARQEGDDRWRCYCPECNLFFKEERHLEDHLNSSHSRLFGSVTPTYVFRATQENLEGSTERTPGDKTDVTAAETTTLGLEVENEPLDDFPLLPKSKLPSIRDLLTQTGQDATLPTSTSRLEELDRHLEEANAHLRAMLDQKIKNNPNLTPPPMLPHISSPNARPFEMRRADAKEDLDHLDVTSNNVPTVNEKPLKRRGRAAPPGRCQSCNRTDTPEWRRGPDGARTLCNACGLHYAKLERKRQLEARAIRPDSKKDILKP